MDSNEFKIAVEELMEISPEVIDDLIIEAQAAGDCLSLSILYYIMFKQSKGE